MEFQKKTIPFLHRGMNWNAPPDKIPEGQLPWAKNVRCLLQGIINSAHGFTELFWGFGENYIHSISRLNIVNPAFDSPLDPTYVVGADQSLYAFQDEATRNNVALNPVKTPLTGQFFGFSGNPLSVVDVQPAGAAVAWKYIGDSQQMVTLGYYPGEKYGQFMAHALTIGMTPPVNRVAVTPLAGGQLNGDYQWIFAYRRVQTGARSNPSAATRFSISHPALTLTNQAASIPSVPETPIDPQTGLPDTNVVVDIYRFGGTIFRWALVGSATTGAPFIDNMPDESLLAAPSPPQATDASTGLTRFNLFRPFVTQDIWRNGNGIVSQAPNGAWIITATVFQFNTDWLPGSIIYIDGIAFTIYQVWSNTVLEIAQDATGQLNIGTEYPWNTLAGTLTAGQPLPHLWGSYGIGQSASYLFACGDPNAPGTLYWTNGNDPDSTDIVNNVVVTSPSEKLQTGCVYNGQPFCWSIERQFLIYPSLTVFGQFTVQEVAGAKGCLLEWSLSVQNNGLADQSVTWRGKDGLYDWSQGGGLRRLTDDLYAFFPHDNQPGIAPETLMPFIGANSAHPEHVGNLDDTQSKYHRTCWFQGVLFYDFVAQDIPQGNTYSCLVWDDVEVKGWVSLDQQFPDTTQPISRSSEVGANNLKFSRGGIIYDYEGLTRGGFETRVITRAEDMGDPRLSKLFGDYWVDCAPLSAFKVVPLTSFHRTALTANVIPAATVRGEYTLDFTDFVANGGKGFLGSTLGLDITWPASDGQFTASLYQWQPSFILKPESIAFRITDRSDEGVIQAKYLMGMNMEANTFGASFTLDVLVDGRMIAQVTVTHDGQTEHPYAWAPVAGYEFQVEMSFPQNVAWELFRIRWIFEPWPDAVTRAYPFQNLGTTQAKYIRQVTLPIETGGAPGTVGLLGDDGQAIRDFPNLVTENLLKTGVPLVPPTPLVAHEIQLSTLTAMRIWPEEAHVDFEVWPELSTETSAFTDCGYKGAKFMQGLIVPLDTNGQPVVLKVTYDGGGQALLGPTTTPAGEKTSTAYSFSPCNFYPSNPFIAHQVQVQPLTPARVFNDEIDWRWEPVPELVYTWRTQETDHDLPGWHSMREAYIAYMGGDGAPVFTITTEYGSLQYTLDPVLPDQYTRCYRVLQPQKAKWRSYRVESCRGLRLFIKDCSVFAKAWGDPGAYRSFQPFGDLSRISGARI